MGYYTHYKLEWDKKSPAKMPCPHCGTLDAVSVSDLIKISVDTEKVTYGGETTIAACLEESSKWYDHETDMRDFSKRFPDVLFTLNGEGEESGDVWVKYFKNGKMQSSKADIKLEKFDPKKLT
jgi:hypothetical protein